MLEIIKYRRIRRLKLFVYYNFIHSFSINNIYIRMKKRLSIRQGRQIEDGYLVT